ncbi:hypothetical protein BLS_003642 [Venturia inaequalis]|uniref:Protein kinase domain-containing protein n=1 Tax=Venturia inaequalis TaxID=5025 RepID=A0A8H3YQQ6_VENIN|nr:hypothetical protein EG328_006690 [Venturia inaequalis]KAE9973351.1 hypothetical protein BLS_003642 [Venturia inaequalis]KAE9976962.1 hypothetical protein EG327_007901 [Venturia inaequalis]RDI83744.1 hypothetical protein Vi05172_g6345 [Venturia inaequalis]
MPHIFFASSEQDHRASSQPPEHSFGEKGNMWGKTWNKVGHWLKKEEENAEPTAHAEMPTLLDEKKRIKEMDYNTTHSRPQRTVVPSLPRPTTFARQNSERREKLCPVEPNPEERRATSIDRKAPAEHFRCVSPHPATLPTSYSPTPHAPDSVSQGDYLSSSPIDQSTSRVQFDTQYEGRSDEEIDLPPHPLLSYNDLVRDPEHLSDALDDLQIQAELEAKWILNLSMHFRDNSDREKFFVTFAEEPSNWRRVTVSCDYRTMPADSLEADLKSLHYQRDKSARIYESIRDSLPDIQFYPTVTNLKLQTSDGRLHVHVTEDVNEIIQYPSVSLLRHIECKRFRESTIKFDSHLSGFVYKVRSGGRVYIKKEIPGPEAVEEFLYEANALSSLRDSPNVVQFEGIVIDDGEQVVKGLLLSYAEQGALVDLIYDYKNTEWLPWTRRERWAKQIIAGLADIHESGFVQGDFTLSNIVIDEADGARIIDINRRGCPVGWEPPELARLIQSGQRISSYIGVKSDLYQLGMVLWALAEQQDEPERQEHPLQFTHPSNVPAYYHGIVQSCLSHKVKDRVAAADLLEQFPNLEKSETRPERISSAQLSPNRSEKKYIDPATAVELEDLDYLKRSDHSRQPSQFSTSEATFADAAPSTEYLFVSSGSEMANARGRSSARTSLDEAMPNPSSSNFRETVDRQFQTAIVETSSTTASLRSNSIVVETREEDVSSHLSAAIPLLNPFSRQDSDKTIVDIKDHIDLDQPIQQDSPPAYSLQEHTLEQFGAADIIAPPCFGPPTHQDSGFDEPTIVDMVCSPHDLTTLYEAGPGGPPASSLENLSCMPDLIQETLAKPNFIKPDEQLSTKGRNNLWNKEHAPTTDLSSSCNPSAGNPHAIKLDELRFLNDGGLGTTAPTSLSDVPVDSLSKGLDHRPAGVDEPAMLNESRQSRRASNSPTTGLAHSEVLLSHKIHPTNQDVSPPLDFNLSTPLDTT